MIPDRQHDPVWISNLPKLIVAVLTIVCVTVLMATHAVEAVAGLPVISATSVYVLTNGIRAERARTHRPVQ